MVQPVTLYPGASGGPPALRVRTSSSYDGFGRGVTDPADGSGMADPVDPIGYGGQYGYYHDYTTGLYLLTHRYYDAGTGRFVSRDLVGYKGGINLYGFAGNNPVNNQDPSGFDPDRDDPTGLPGDNDGHWNGTTSATGVNEGFKRGTSQNNARRSMTKGLGSIFWDTVLGMLNPEGKAAEVLAEGTQAFRAVRPLSSPHYSVAFEANLQRGVHYPGRSAFSHFAEANRQLHTFMQSNLEYAQQLEHMFPGIGRAVSPGRRGAYSRLAPPGTSWHHHPTREGVLQLMPRAQHGLAGLLQSILHPGGRGGMENWGGGR